MAFGESGSFSSDTEKERPKAPRDRQKSGESISDEHFVVERTKPIRKKGKKFDKPKTEVHRTRYIYGLNGLKAAAENRRFDIRKILKDGPEKADQPSLITKSAKKQSFFYTSHVDNSDDGDSYSFRSSEFSAGSSSSRGCSDISESCSWSFQNTSCRKVSWTSGYQSTEEGTYHNFPHFYRRRQSRCSANTCVNQTEKDKRPCCLQSKLWLVLFFMVMIGTGIALVVSKEDTNEVSHKPSSVPSMFQTEVSHKPSSAPSIFQTEVSQKPSSVPSIFHTEVSHKPSSVPTIFQAEVSHKPSSVPSVFQTEVSQNPSSVPSVFQPEVSHNPSYVPTIFPTEVSHNPSSVPSILPTALPTKQTSPSPSISPTKKYEWIETRGRLIGGPKIHHDYGRYGTSVALSKDGETLAVSARESLEVEIYDNLNGTWVIRGKPIPVPHPLVGEPYPKEKGIPEYGVLEVDLSANGNIVAIGRRDTQTNTGLVRVFSWNSKVWTQLGQTLYGQGRIDGFGVDVGLSASGIDMVVAALGRGATVFRFNGTHWVQRGDSFGKYGHGLAYTSESVCITDDGMYFAVASSMFDRSVHFFKWDRDHWVQLSPIWPDTESDGYDGYASGIQLTKLPTGSLVAAVNCHLCNGGEIRVYDYDLNDGGNVHWVERSSHISVPHSRQVGDGLALSDDGNSIVASFDWDADVYDWDGSLWIKRGHLLSIPGGNNYFSLAPVIFWFAISGEGSTVVVGLPHDEDGWDNGENIGQVRTFEWKR